jgi:hypothetical protein
MAMDRCSTTRRCLLGRVRLRPCLAANLQDRAPLVGPPRLCWRGALGQTPPPLARRCARTAVLIRLRRRSPCRRTPCRRSPRRPSAGDHSEAASFHVAGVCRVHPQCRRRQPRPAGSDRRTRSGEPPRLVGGPRAAAAAPRPRLGATGPAPCAPPFQDPLSLVGLASRWVRERCRSLGHAPLQTLSAVRSTAEETTGAWRPSLACRCLRARKPSRSLARFPSLRIRSRKARGKPLPAVHRPRARGGGSSGVVPGCVSCV